MSFCSNCGQQLPDNSVFCPNCGVRIPAEADIQNTGYTSTEAVNANHTEKSYYENTESNTSSVNEGIRQIKKQWLFSGDKIKNIFIVRGAAETSVTIENGEIHIFGDCSNDINKQCYPVDIKKSYSKLVSANTEKTFEPYAIFLSILFAILEVRAVYFAFNNGFTGSKGIIPLLLTICILLYPLSVYVKHLVSYNMILSWADCENTVIPVSDINQINDFLKYVNIR